MSNNRSKAADPPPTKTTKPGKAGRTIEKPTGSDTKHSPQPLLEVTDNEQSQRMIDLAAQLKSLTALSRLVTGVAHEVNTPLGVSITAASHIHDQAQNLEKRFLEATLKKDDFRTFIKEINDASDLLHRSLKSLSDLISEFKQVSADEYPETKQRFNVRACLLESLESLQLELLRSACRIQFSCGPNITLYSFPNALSTAIQQLIINALEHGFEQPRMSNTISISVTPGEKRLILEFSDNGRGISPQELKQIFDPFYTTGRGAGHNGLGLNIAYNLVSQKLNGQMECVQGPKGGILFHISLPNSEPTNPD